MGFLRKVLFLEIEKLENLGSLECSKTVDKQGDCNHFLGIPRRGLSKQGLGPTEAKKAPFGTIPTKAPTEALRADFPGGRFARISLKI